MQRGSTRFETNVASLQEVDRHHRRGVAGEPHVELRVGALPRDPPPAGRVLEEPVVLWLVETRVVRCSDEAAVEQLVEVGERVRVIPHPAKEREVPRPARLDLVGSRDCCHVHLEAELLEVPCQSLPVPERRVAGQRVDDDLPAGQTLPRQLLRPAELRALERVDVRVSDVRKARRQVPVGGGADERAARRYTPDRRPVDRVAHRAPQARIAKQSPRGIERERSQKETGLDEEATVRAVDPVLLVEAREEVRGRGAGVTPVGLPGFDLADHVLERGGGEVGHEALDVLRTRAAIVRIPLQHDLPARDVLCDVVGTGGGQRSLDPFRVGRRVRRDRTEGRHGHPRREVRRGVFQPDDEAVALRDDSLGAPPTAVPHRLRPHDVFRVGGGVRPRPAPARAFG